MHQARNCPVSSAEQRRPVQQPTPAQQPPDVRPMKDNSNKQDKTCIWVKYRQNKISALIDTGSDVSIAGENVARDNGWTVHTHRTKEVSVANQETMSVIGVVRVVLYVAGHGVESEILIAPDLDGLILGIDWLQSQGRIKWDFKNGRIQLGNKEWVKLRTEAEQPSRTSIFKLDQNWSPNKCWESTPKQVEHHLSFEQGDCLTEREKDASSLRVRRRLFKEAVEDEHLHLNKARDMSTRCPFRDTNSIKVANEDNLNTMMVETTDETLMPSSLPHLPYYTKKFSANNIPLSSSVRLWESRDVRFMPTMCAESLREQEGTGLRTVIIMRIKEVGKEGRQECENFPDVCCGKEERQKNENFPVVRHRTKADGGEGHQEQEIQSVNPSIESS